jgi:hypothetical protein
MIMSSVVSTGTITQPSEITVELLSALLPFMAARQAFHPL